MKLALPLKDWIGIITTIVLVTLSWASNMAIVDKNNALLNQKVDQLLMSQTSTQASLTGLSSEVVDLKLADSKTEARVEALEKIYPSLSLMTK